MELIYNQAKTRYEAVSTFAEKDIPKAAGFRWNREDKVWWSDDAMKALHLIDFADETVKPVLEEAKAYLDKTRKASRAEDADFEVPCPEGLSWLPYQRAGVAFAAQRPATLLADDMGLGKTPQTVGVINLDASIKRILIICPASLRLNWKRELERWLTRSYVIGVVEGATWPKGAEIVIINYDILSRHAAKLRAQEWDLLVADEAHYLKNAKAKRTQAVVGKAKKGGGWDVEPLKAKRRLLLTGTPIVNRPAELFTLVNYLDPERWPNFFSYAKRYCNARYNGYGYDFSGSSHLDELQDTLRSTVMIRRMKDDVLKDLPGKRRQVIELPANGASGAVKAEQAAYAAHRERLQELRVAVELAKAAENPEEYAQAVERLREAASVAFTEMARARHDVALAKVPYVVDHLKEAIEAHGKVVVFAHHIDVVNALRAAFEGEAVELTGRTPMKARQEAVDRFQEDPNTTLFIGNIQAAGVGITLTAAAHVVFAELDWVPGNLSQAEDRCRRIGQTESVLVQHLVLEGSIDANMARRIVEKQAVLDAALDKDHGDVKLKLPEVPVVPQDAPAATQHATPEGIALRAATLSPEKVVAVHTALQLLAGVCDGAIEQDGMGFNGIDARIGHSLATAGHLSPKQAALGQRIIRKYHRQLPGDVYKATGCR